MADHQEPDRRDGGGQGVPSTDGRLQATGRGVPHTFHPYPAALLSRYGASAGRQRAPVAAGTSVGPGRDAAAPERPLDGPHGGPPDGSRAIPPGRQEPGRCGPQGGDGPRGASAWLPPPIPLAPPGFSPRRNSRRLGAASSAAPLSVPIPLLGTFAAASGGCPLPAQSDISCGRECLSSPLSGHHVSGHSGHLLGLCSWT